MIDTSAPCFCISSSLIITGLENLAYAEFYTITASEKLEIPRVTAMPAPAAAPKDSDWHARTDQDLPKNSKPALFRI
jgi:hypothetical protein